MAFNLDALHLHDMILGEGRVKRTVIATRPYFQIRYGDGSQSDGTSNGHIEWLASLRGTWIVPSRVRLPEGI